MPQPTLPMDPSEIHRLRGDDKYPWAFPEPLPLSPSDVHDFLRMAPTLGRTDDPLDFVSRRKYKCSPLDVCLMAIDPATGDSMLHAIVKAGNLDGLYAIQETFGRTPCTSVDRVAQLLLTHQSHEGKTALHSAVDTGRIQMVRALIRLFYFSGIADSLDTPGQRRAGEGFSVRDIELNQLSPYHVRAVLFVDTKDKAGRNVAAEARANGHDDVADFLEDFLFRMDPKGRRMQTDYRRRMEEYLREYFRFLELEETYRCEAYRIHNGVRNGKSRFTQIAVIVAAR